jgi:hypothetical protein
LIQLEYFFQAVSEIPNGFVINFFVYD